jgi:hypothetical protein
MERTRVFPFTIYYSPFTIHHSPFPLSGGGGSFDLSAEGFGVEVGAEARDVNFSRRAHVAVSCGAGLRGEGGRDFRA